MQLRKLFKRNLALDDKQADGPPFSATAGTGKAAVLQPDVTNIAMAQTVPCAVSQASKVLSLVYTISD